MSYFLGGLIGFFLCIVILALLTRKAYKNSKTKIKNNSITKGVKENDINE